MRRLAVSLSLVVSLSCGGALKRENVDRDASGDATPLADAALLPEGEASAQDAGDSDAPGQLAPGCCNVPSDCGDIMQQVCVQHLCLSSPGPGRCWDATQCPAQAPCIDARVCGCAATCGAPDVAGTCAAVGDGASSKDAGDAAALSSSDAAPPRSTTLCAPDAGLAPFNDADPAVQRAWSGANGAFVDACDANGNLTKYSCEPMLVCGPGPNPSCTEFDTGVVKPAAIDCAGHCVAGACPSRCPTFGDILTVQSVNAAGGASFVDAVDGRTFTCTLESQQPGSGFDCVANVHVGTRGTFSSQGFHGSYCTGANIGSIGLCYPGASACNGQDCTYACSVAR